MVLQAATKRPVPSSSRILPGSPQDLVDDAVEALSKVLRKEDVTNNSLKRLLLVWHPDKVKDTGFEPVFNRMTQIINSLRENAR